jgi:hypothetical protein
MLNVSMPHDKIVCLLVFVSWLECGTCWIQPTHNFTTKCIMCQRLVIGFSQIVEKMEKLDIYDNKKWLFYIESQFTFQIGNNKPKIIKSTNRWAMPKEINVCIFKKTLKVKRYLQIWYEIMAYSKYILDIFKVYYHNEF